MKKFPFALTALAVSCFSTSMLGLSATHGVDRANLDEKVKPGEDFYQYACGGWMAANPLTDEYSRYGTFDQLGELNRKQLYDLVMGLNPAAAEKPDYQQNYSADKKLPRCDGGRVALWRDLLCNYITARAAQ